ncbi:MAG: type IV pili methyl-accepting chemotaxis transducer N-terminal domain-containing protein [Paracoccaceae bacterium]
MFGLKFTMVAAVAAIALTPAQANTSNASIQKERMDLAGKERMLIQRIVKSSCLVMSNIDTEHYAVSAIKDTNTFEATLADLISGSTERNWPPEENSRTLAQLQDTYVKWKVLRPAALQVSHGDLMSFAVSQIITETDTTVTAMDTAVTGMANLSHNTGVDPKISNTLNAAGKQRMLSQKLAKEFCFLHNDVSAELHRELLIETAATFEKNLNKLLNADTVSSEFIAPPTPQTERHLENAKRIWQDLFPIMQHAINGKKTTHDDLENVAHMSDELLSEMIAAVNAYVAGTT